MGENVSVRADALAGIDAGLRTFIEPQIDQLGLAVHPVRSGIVCSGRELCEGGVWAAQAGPHCLLTYNQVRFRGRTYLEEHPRSCLCVATGTASSVAQTPPNRRPRRAQATDNLVVFARPDATQGFELETGASYGMCAFSFLPAFFREVAREGAGRSGGVIARAACGQVGLTRAGCAAHDPDPYEALLGGLAELDPDALPHDLRPAFALLDVTRADEPSAPLHVRAAALEIAAVMLDHATAAARAREERDCQGQRELVAKAKRLVQERLGQPPSIDELARALYVGRTRLCEAFHAETGESLGRYARRLRLERACELLATTDDPLDAVARAVGYRRPGSLSEAFRAEFGQTPSAWRAERR